MWESKSLAQVHTELGFDRGLPASLWSALFAPELLLVLLFKVPRAPPCRLAFPGLGLSGTICEMGKLRGGTDTTTSSRSLRLELCQALHSTPSQYLLADHSSWWRRSAWARRPALLLPGSWLWARASPSQSFSVQSWKMDIRTVPTVSSILL